MATRPTPGGSKDRSARSRQRETVERGDQITIALVGEGAPGDRQFEPLHLVDLVRRCELAVEDVHEPVGDELGPVAAVAVLGVSGEASHPAAQAGLLLHLAQSTILEGLVLRQFAFGK